MQTGRDVEVLSLKICVKTSFESPRVPSNYRVKTKRQTRLELIPIVSQVKNAQLYRRKKMFTAWFEKVKKVIFINNNEALLGAWSID